MKVVDMIGARPQFIKLAPILKAVERHNQNHPGRALFKKFWSTQASITTTKHLMSSLMSSVSRLPITNSAWVPAPMAIKQGKCSRELKKCF